MKKKILIVIDMQKDFIDGSLANKDAEHIVKGIVDKIKMYNENKWPVYFTRDTHGEDYMSTQEGKILPVPHCIKGSEGWKIIQGIGDYACSYNTLDKPTFGSLELPKWIKEKLGTEPDDIEMVGTCTDICVISNAMILKAAFPETEIAVDGKLCAGVTPESHNNALEAMKMCQINVK